MELHALEEMAVRTTEPEKSSGMAAYQPAGVFPAVTPPGMAYVPYQQWGDVYEAEKGFGKGTMFPVLDYPFTSVGGECAS